MVTAVRTPSRSILMLVLNDVRFDSRVRAEAGTLAAAGYTVRVIGTLPADNPLPDRETPGGWELVRFRYSAWTDRLRRVALLKRLRHLIQAVQLVRFLRRQEADIWHAHDFPALLLVVLARFGRRHPSRLVYDSHELYFYQVVPPSQPMHALATGLEGWLARRADLILANSPYRATFMAEHWHCSLPVTILNGMAPPQAGKGLPRPDGARRWLIHTGNLMRRGRRLLALLHGLAATPPDVHLTFLGEGEHQPDLAALAVRLGLQKRVHFVPPVPPEDVSTAIQGADAAVMAISITEPSYALSVPTKLLEAIAGGLPVLASRTPAFAGFLARYPIGCLWDADRPASLAEALARLDDPDQRAAWQTALHTTQRECGWEAQAPRLVEAYARLDTAP